MCNSFQKPKIEPIKITFVDLRRTLNDPIILDKVKILNNSGEIFFTQV